MKNYLILYDSSLDRKDVQLSAWAMKRARFSFKSCSFKNAPLYKQSDGDYAIKPEWLEGKAGKGWDGIVAYTKGDKLKGMWGTHLKRFPSIVQVEHHSLYREYKGAIGFAEFTSTKKKTPYPQPEYTLDHELMHSLNWLARRSDLLHTFVKLRLYDTYKSLFPL